MALTAMSLASASSALAKRELEPPVVYGPAPSWEVFRELAEQAVRTQLVDPDSARFSWLWGYQQGFYKPMLAKRVHGYTACGLVNARNRMGGYTGDTWFVVVIDNDMVRYVEIALNAYSVIGDQCTKAKLPPLASFQSPQPQKAILGVMFMSEPAGIRVIRVVPGSPAERAGIKQDMVIARVNGISLKGLPQTAAQQMLQNLAGTATIELTSGAVISVERP
jgi:hypothetical protein